VVIVKLANPIVISYAKTENDVTTRTIIPYNLPTPNVGAWDVTSLDDDQIDNLADAYAKYIEYRNVKLSTIMKFEDWIVATDTLVDLAILKYRSFSPGKMTITEKKPL